MAIREYFYYVSHLGGLYPLECREALRCARLPFGPASVKGSPLDFIMARVVPNAEARDEFKWVSPCGKERNYLAAAYTPVVFHTLEEEKARLVYAHSLWVPFEPGKLVVDERGELFHPHPRLGNCLVKTHLLQEWMQEGRIVVEDNRRVTWK